MDALTVFLLYLACGAATFPLTIMLVRGVVSVAAPARATPAFHQRLDSATGWSITVWILGVFVFYAAAILRKENTKGKVVKRKEDERK